VGDYLSQKFPRQIDAIQAFKAKDATFREVCADYQEICTWLAAHDCSAARDPEEWGTARALKRDLEDEILKLLEEHDGISS